MTRPSSKGAIIPSSWAMRRIQRSLAIIDPLLGGGISRSAPDGLDAGETVGAGGDARRRPACLLPPVRRRARILAGGRAVPAHPYLRAPASGRRVSRGRGPLGGAPRKVAFLTGSPPWGFATAGRPGVSSRKGGRGTSTGLSRGRWGRMGFPVLASRGFVVRHVVVGRGLTTTCRGSTVWGMAAPRGRVLSEGGRRGRSAARRKRHP